MNNLRIDTMSGVFLFTMAALAILIPSTSMSSILIIDDFRYPNADAAKASWAPADAALPAEPATIEGVRCLRLPSRFRADTVRAIWDKQVHLDLSQYNRFTFRFKMEDCSTVRMVSLYFNSGGTGWYANLSVGSVNTEKWQQVVVTSFGCEGNCPGWNDIRTIRLSIWQTKPAETSFAIADFRAEKVEGPENLLPNGSFEICTTERLPDYWGSGHWGICASNWVADTDAWRARWGVDDKVSHSGKRSLRIVGASNPADLKAVANWAGVLAGNPFTLSAWMKSDRTDLPVVIGMSDPGSQKVMVGQTWKRYSFTGTPGSSPVTCMIWPEADGTLWIDDVQLERGDKPSEFRPALLDSSLTGQAVHRATPQLPSFELKPGPESIRVKIDEHRRFLVNGEPFIPFAAGWESKPSPEIIRDIARAGFNSICVCLGPQSVEECKKTLDCAQSNGLKVILWVFSQVSPDLLRQWVTGLKDHPALIAWYVYDEPASLTPEVKEKYEIARTLDPSRPAYINYVLYPTDQLGDIASLDDYPLPNGNPLAIAGDADTMEHFASKSGKPSWIWLQDTGNAYFMSREPTGPEEECMVYLALIHGVKGIKFFAQKPRSKELWDTLKQLAREVRALTPILYSIEDAPKATASPAAIHLVVKKFKGDVYLIALNARPEPVVATFNVSLVNGRTTVLFENRSVAVRKSKLTDKFLGYQRHVYRLRM